MDVVGGGQRTVSLGHPDPAMKGWGLFGEAKSAKPYNRQEGPRSCGVLGWGKQGEWAWCSLCFGQGPRRIVPQGRPGFGEQGLWRESLHV